MKKRCLAICILCVFLMCSFVVCADEPFSNVVIDYKREQGTVEISGNVSSLLNGAQSVQLLVLKPGTNMEALFSDEILFLTQGVHASETVLNEDGFAFEAFTLPEGSSPGDYIVKIAADSYTYETVFSYATVSQTIDILNNAENAEKVLESINKYNDVYGLEIGTGSAWEKLSADGKNYVLDKLLQADLLNVADVKNTFDEHVVLYGIYTGPWGAIEEIIKNDALLLGFDTSVFSTLSNTQKDNVYKSLVGNLYATKQLASDAFNAAVLLQTTSSPGQSQGNGGNNGGGNSSYGGGDIVLGAQVPQTTPPAGKKHPFIDLGAYKWAEEAIERLYSAKIVSGRSENEFVPNGLVTRAEVAKMIVLSIGEADESAVCSFSDVKASAWSYPYLATAEKLGIINGYEDGTSGADEFVKREDLCVMVLRAANIKGKFTENAADYVFSDSDEISSYAKSAVNKLVNAKIVSGTDNNMFMPKSVATRAETAKIITALL